MKCDTGGSELTMERELVVGGNVKAEGEERGAALYQGNRLL